MLPFSRSLRKLTISVLYTAMLVIGFLGYTNSYAQCFVNSRIKKITANVSPYIKSYLEFKPVDWNATSTKKHPLIVYIGGTGEMFQQPGGSDYDLCPVLQYSMPWRMNVGHFPDYVTDNSGQQFSYLVVMPFVTKWEQQYNVDPGAMIDYALQAYPNKIDLNRIYLTGMSRGTDNLMGYATSSLTAANRIAAVVPVGNCFPANVGTTLYNTQVSNLANGNVRLWGISCAGDRVCSETYMQNWVSSLNQQKPGNALFTFATLSCDTAGPNASYHYAWNHAYDPDYKVAPGNKNVYQWMIQFAKNTNTPPPPPPPPPANCSTIVFSTLANAIKVKGLIAPVATVQIFNGSWATVYNQTFNNSPDSIVVSNLPAGTYFVKVNFYNTNWTHICEKSQSVTVTNTGEPPPPPPPPPPPTGCTNVTASAGTGRINFSGLTSPVLTVQIFNNSWATIYNQTFTNSPGTLAVTVPTGTYHAKVTFYTSSWSYVCDKMIDVTVTTATTAAPPDYTETSRSQTVQSATVEEANMSTGKRIAVAPNPFVNTLWLTIGSNKTENANISIVDLTGRVIMNKSITLQRGVNRLSLTEVSKYRPGSYYLRLTTSEGVENVRLIRQ